MKCVFKKVLEVNIFDKIMPFKGMGRGCELLSPGLCGYTFSKERQTHLNSDQIKLDLSYI